MMRTILLFLFIGSTLFSNAFDPDPSVIVEGCVNALTGEFFIREDDVIIKDKHPLTLTRTYSSKTKTGELAPHTTLILRGEPVKQGKKKKKKGKKPAKNAVYKVAELKEPTGQLLTYRLANNQQFALQIPCGAVNTTQEMPSGATSPHNQQLIRLDTFTFKLITPEKIERIYSKGYSQNQDLYFLLRSEQYPDGHFKLYEYDHKHRLFCIKCTDSTQTQLFSHCKFRYFGNSSYEITTSDGQKLIHNMDGSTLRSVQGSACPEEVMEYAQGHLHKRTIIGRKTLRIDYLHNGKVHALRNEQGICLHTFSYFPTYTEVIHADQSKTRYTYTTYPEKIEEFTPDQMLKKSTTMQWNTRGELLCKTVRDANGAPLSHQTLSYDERGNPLEEIVNGVLIKRKFDPLDRLTLLITDKTTHYQYLDNSNLIASIALGTADKIWIQTHFAYDQNNQLKEVTNEGDLLRKTYTIEGDPNYPTAVTESIDGHILKKTCYREKNGALFQKIYGEDGRLYSKRLITTDQIQKPWEIHFFKEELDADVERDFFGRVTALRYYDPCGILIKEESWKYDTFHLLSYTDPEGTVTRYLYNSLGQKEKELIETSKGTIETTFFYDPIGRLEKIQTGELFTSYRYNEQDEIYEVIEETSSGICIGKQPYKKETPPKLLLTQLAPGIQKTYDFLGQLIELSTEDGTVHYTLKYNKRGEVTLLEDHIHQRISRRHYDNLGNLIEETLLNGLNLQSTYDLRSRRTQLILPDHSRIRYRFGPKYLEEIQRIPLDDTSEYRHRFVAYNLAGIPISQRMIGSFGELSLDVDENNSVSGIHTRYFHQTLESRSTDEFNGLHKPCEFHWDGLGRITQITQPNRQIFFTYDIWNRRMSKQVYECIDEQWEEKEHLLYFYDDQKEIGAMEDGALKQLRVLTPKGDQAIGMELENLIYAPIHDLDGNVKLLLSTIRNKVMESYTYSISGRELITDYWEDLIPESKAKNPWRYRFERTDDETGLIYINGNYYDPITQKFITL